MAGFSEHLKDGISKACLGIATLIGATFGLLGFLVWEVFLDLLWLLLFLLYLLRRMPRPVRGFRKGGWNPR